MSVARSPKFIFLIKDGGEDCESFYRRASLDSFGSQHIYMSASQYARLVPKKYRNVKLPKINRKWRPRVIAWAGPTAFYPNRFYEIDQWYKARIDKPVDLPRLHIINPSDHLRSLSQILADNNAKRINVGFQSRDEWKDVKSDEQLAKLEKLARTKQLLLDTDVACGSSSRVAEHFGVFEDLFAPGVFFDNTQNVDVHFGDNVVYSGNILHACDTINPPQVEMESFSKGFNTLIAVNIDGSPVEGELLHWMVVNICHGRMESGVETASYLQALPFQGTGYHRFAFVFFRHQKPLSVDNIGSSLSSRIFSMRRWYKEHEDEVTPSAIRFSNVSFDYSVKTCLHSQGERSPIYEYSWNEAEKRPQKEFPKKPQPFNLYLDMYRDPKEVAEGLVTDRIRAGFRRTRPPYLDLNYNENKKDMDPWIHQQMLARNRGDNGFYDNAIKS